MWLDIPLVFFALLTQGLASKLVRAIRIGDRQVEHMVDSMVYALFDQASHPVYADLSNTSLGARPLTILAREGSLGVSSRSDSALRRGTRLSWRPLARGRFRSSRVAVAPQVFEPQMPEGTAQGFLATFAVLYATSQVWWNSVIPTKREEVMKSKRQGEIKEYIDNLRNESSQEESRGFERWLFTDWIRQANREGGKKAAALPFLKKAKWNSGDNPILVAFGVIMGVVISESFLEREAFKR